MSSDKQWWAAGANQINRWLVQNQLRSLDEAYRGALQIQELERQYFGGDRIAFRADLSKTVFDYVKTKRDRQLLRVRANLARFRLTSFLQNADAASEPATPTAQEQQILEKLGFIELVVGKYRDLDDALEQMMADLGSEPTSDATAAPMPNSLPKDLRISPGNAPSSKPPMPMRSGGTNGSESILNRLSSIGKELSKELSPLSEQEVVTELRLRRKQNRIAMRWLAVLLLLPLLTQVLTKNLVFEPLLGNYSDRHPSAVELSTEIEEEFLAEFSEYREALEIQRLLKNYQPPATQSQGPFWQRKRSFFNQAIENDTLTRSSINPLTRQEALPLVDPIPLLDRQTLELNRTSGGLRGVIVTTDLPESPEFRAEEDREYELALQEKAVELWREAREKQLDGLKNVLADVTSILVLGALVYFGRDRLRLLGNFSNRTFLALSDPAKVFLFILVTDIFVGFHSAEGWEVILEGVSRHFGLPESKVFINGFIATVPVFIDACIKFWIFSYLTRYSPSASAIYERMNT